MKHTQSQLYRQELQGISDVLELINYRPRTIDSYLQSIFECCTWLQATYTVSLDQASIPQLRAFLLHLKRTKDSGGLGYAPRSVNIYNCALKKYFRFVLPSQTMIFLYARWTTHFQKSLPKRMSLRLFSARKILSIGLNWLLRMAPR